jgi:hypothetical protein
MSEWITRNCRGGYLKVAKQSTQKGTRLQAVEIETIAQGVIRPSVRFFVAFQLDFICPPVSGTGAELACLDGHAAAVRPTRSHVLSDNARRARHDLLATNQRVPGRILLASYPAVAFEQSFVAHSAIPDVFYQSFVGSCQLYLSVAQFHTASPTKLVSLVRTPPAFT